MSSKVNNKVPHTGINSIGTSFAQAQAKMALATRDSASPRPKMHWTPMKINTLSELVPSCYLLLVTLSSYLFICLFFYLYFTLFYFSSQDQRFFYLALLPIRCNFAFEM